jgi:hypothetical protein
MQHVCDVIKLFLDSIGDDTVTGTDLHKAHGNAQSDITRFCVYCVVCCKYKVILLHLFCLGDEFTPICNTSLTPFLILL